MLRPSKPESLSSAQIVEELLSVGSLLVKRQAVLARLELERQFARERTVVEALGVGALFAVAALILFLVAAAAALGVALGGRLWTGALVIGGALLLVAAITSSVGWARRVRSPLERTRGLLRKEVAWMKAQRTA